MIEKNFWKVDTTEGPEFSKNWKQWKVRTIFEKGYFLNLESFGLFIMLLPGVGVQRFDAVSGGHRGRWPAAVAAAAVAAGRVSGPRNALLPGTLPSTPLPPMLVVVVMGVTYAEGIKCCSELESLASLTTTIITTTFTYWINTNSSK